MTNSHISTALHRAQQACIQLVTTTSTDRSRAIQAMAAALKDAKDEILHANTLDLEASREMAVPEVIADWLKLTQERLERAVRTLKRLGELPDPIGRVLPVAFQPEACQSYTQLLPLGVVAFIYEALPELGAIAAGLCLKTANSLILRGGSEASYSNQVIANTLQGALEEVGMPPGCLQLLPAEAGESIRDLVVQDNYLNLIIPYGRASLVQQVVQQATAPVLRSAMGNCYLYWGNSGSVSAVQAVVLDSHQSLPDPVNAIEKVLINPDHNGNELNSLWGELRRKGFHLRADADLRADFPDLELAAESEWDLAYLNRTVAFKKVKDVSSAIAWINQHSSGHADCIVTESYLESRQFALELNSAITYINASPRFYRHPQRGEAIFLGMSNQKGQRRGLIGLETLTTPKTIIQGSSPLVSPS